MQRGCSSDVAPLGAHSREGPAAPSLMDVCDPGESALHLSVAFHPHGGCHPVSAVRQYGMHCIFCKLNFACLFSLLLLKCFCFYLVEMIQRNRLGWNINVEQLQTTAAVLIQDQILGSVTEQLQQNEQLCCMLHC